MMADFKNVKYSLESQVRDLEKIYIDEVKHNTELAKKNEHLVNYVNNSFIFTNNFKTQFDKLNKILMDDYQRTRKEIENMKGQSE
jgi:hypothetical protein